MCVYCKRTKGRVDICKHPHIQMRTRTGEAGDVYVQYARASSSYCADSYLVDAENRYERFVNYACQDSGTLVEGDPILLLAASRLYH